MFKLKLLGISLLFLYVDGESITEAQVIKWIFRDYSPTAAPKVPISVQLTIHIKDIQFHNKNYLDLATVFKESWLDERFRFQDLISAHYTKIPDHVTVKNIEQLWTPGITVQNDIISRHQRNQKHNTVIEISPQGVVNTSSQEEHRVPCDMSNLWTYPYDSISCTLFITAISVQHNDMTLKWNETTDTTLSEFTRVLPNVGAYKVVKTLQTSTNCEPSQIVSTLSVHSNCLSMQFVLKRRSDQRNMFVLCYQPAVVICFSWLAFFIRKWQTVGPFFLLMTTAIYVLQCAYAYSVDSHLISGSIVETYFFGGLLLLFAELVAIVIMSYFEVWHEDGEKTNTYTLVEEGKSTVRVQKDSRKFPLCRLVFIAACALAFILLQIIVWGVLANQ